MLNTKKEVIKLCASFPLNSKKIQVNPSLESLDYSERTLKY